MATQAVKRILLTPGEPAGIGPDICLKISQQSWPVELVTVVDPELFRERSRELGLSVTLLPCDLDSVPQPSPPGTLKYIPITRAAKTVPGQINLENSSYVLESLQMAANICLAKKAASVVTGPVQKSALNAAGLQFQGHTEFLAKCANVAETLMVFVVPGQKPDQTDLIVALATTHLPLKDVPQAITFEKLQAVIRLFHYGLKDYFALSNPRILVCGLNPHAGENGYLGREEIEVITPTLEKLRNDLFDVKGPYSADSIFLPHLRETGDAILALYHDQALPVVKYASFGKAVNVTFGLPFIRTSVDHGTALDLAGTGKAESASLAAALQLAVKLSR